MNTAFLAATTAEDKSAVKDQTKGAAINGVLGTPPPHSTHSDPPIKHHSQEADELDFLCSKLSDVRVRHRNGVDDDDIRLSDVSEEQFVQMVNNVNKNDISTMKDSVVKFRKLLAREDIHPHLERIVQSGVVKRFVQLLSHSLPELQFESAWILTNVAAGTSSQTAAVVEAKAVPNLIELLTTSPYKEIKEQCAWCLGNIAGDSAVLRENIINQGALQELINLITSEMNEFLASSTYVAEVTTRLPTTPRKSHNYNLSTLRIAIWALSNFCRGNAKSQLDWGLLDIALPILSQVIVCCSPGSEHTDDEIVMDACWALSRTLRGIHEGVSKVIVDKDVCVTIGSLITYENPDVQVPALRCLINIVSGCDAQTQVVIDSGIVRELHSLLGPIHNDTVRKETCLIISNITAGLPNQVQAVISEGVFPTLIDIARHGEHRTRREAFWAIGNALLNHEFHQVALLVEMGILVAMFESITDMQINNWQDDRIALKILESLKNVLVTGDKAPKEFSDPNNLLERFNGMSIDAANAQPHNGNSGPSNVRSSNQNPFIRLFMEKPSPKSVCGISCLQFLATCNDMIAEVNSAASRILRNWFPNRTLTQPQ